MEAVKSKSRKSSERADKKLSKVDVPLCVSKRPKLPAQEIIVGEELAKQIGHLAVAIERGNPRAVFFGNPGQGKTATVSNMSSGSARPFWWLRVDRFAAEMMEKGGFDFHGLFSAAEAANAVMVFDDFDGFIRRREEKGDTLGVRAAVTGWLGAVDEFIGRVAIIATTNLPGSFEPAIFRRFDHILHFKRLGDDELRKIFASYEGLGNVSQGVLSEARQVSPAELVQMIAMAQLDERPLETLENHLQYRLRTLRIAGIPA